MSPFSGRSLDVSTEGEKQTAITLELYVTSNGNLLIRVEAVIFFRVVIET
jgi:hypothetical protein